MKKMGLRLGGMALAVLTFVAEIHAAEVPFSGTNTISGLVRIVNVDNDILARLGPPGDEGIGSFAVFANSDPPESFQAVKVIYTLDHLSAPYELTVTADNAPLTYNVYAYLALDGSEEYWTSLQPAAPVTSNSPPATVNFDECVALIELRYVDGNGLPVAALGGRATVTETGPPYSLRARYSTQPPGRTENFLVVPSGIEFELAVEVDTGTDIYLDRLTHRETHVMTLSCEDKPVITIVLPDAGTRGTIIGNANLVGEIELPTDGYLELLGRPVIKARGPLGNQRYDGLPAEAPGADVARPFELENLVPSDPAAAWRVQAEMQFGDGYRFQYFQTPALGDGLNAGVEVTAGNTTDLGDTFVMNPARLVGRITLTGPPDIGANLSALRGLTRAADYDPNMDGVPDGVGPGGIGGSYVNASGVDELVPDSIYTTAGASAAASFAGAFNPVTSAFEGDYELVLGMLADQPGIWRQDSLTYAFYHPGTNGGPYVDQLGNVAEQTPWQGTLAADGRATNNLRYGFAEVCVRIRAAVPFYSPRINASGGLTNIDSEGHFRSYRVGSDYGYGRPLTAAEASPEGFVTLYLPEGHYTLTPTVNTIDSSGESATQLRSIEVSVAAGERYCVEDCIQLVIEPPVCTATYGFLATARAVSCDGTLTNLILRASPLSDPSIRLGYSDIRILIGSRTNLTTAHGLFPEFDGFDRALYKDILYTATALDNQGRVSVRQIVAHYDLLPPTLNCPGDMTVTAANGTDAMVDFEVTGTDASDPFIIVCQPPTSTVFPIGTFPVTCTARDLCRNTNSCTFQVTVREPNEDCLLRIALTQLSPPEVTVTWDCTGTLECAPSVEGPWTSLNGATSPYPVSADAREKFFRVRREE